MTNRLKTAYANWKAARIFAHPTTPGAYYNQMNQYPTKACVSEGQGYAMLIVALFGGYDSGGIAINGGATPNGQATFDGLLKMARTWYAFSRVNATYGNAGYSLMNWALYTSAVNGGDGYDAPDGDLDIALALLMAHRQWGSTGTWNYLQEAINTIQALYTVRHYTSSFGGHLSAVQDSNTTRTSDFMIQHFRDFARADTTHAQFWGTDLINNYYRIINYIQQNYSPSAGLHPDFVINSQTATPAPTAGAQGTTDPGSTSGGYYAYNACRNPWRIGTDIYFNNDPNWRTSTLKLTDFFYNKYVAAGGGVAGVMTAIDGPYKLDGTWPTPGGDDMSFIAPIMVGVGSLVSYRAGYQNFLNDLWSYMTTHMTTGYYGSELQLCAMATVAGHWWRPMV
jgi:hypothetical protein